MEIVFAAIITGLFGVITVLLAASRRAVDQARDLATIVRDENTQQHEAGQAVLRDLVEAVYDTRADVRDVKIDVRKVVGRVDRLERAVNP